MASSFVFPRSVIGCIGGDSYLYVWLDVFRVDLYSLLFLLNRHRCFNVNANVTSCYWLGQSVIKASNEIQISNGFVPCGCWKKNPWMIAIISVIMFSFNCLFVIWFLVLSAVIARENDLLYFFSKADFMLNRVIVAVVCEFSIKLASSHKKDICTVSQ